MSLKSYSLYILGLYFFRILVDNEYIVTEEIPFYTHFYTQKC